MMRIVALTEAGRALALRLQAAWPDSEVWYKPKPFARQLQQAFVQGDRLLLICATGIAVRSLAPVITDKHRDPPVLVLDELGRFVIPLLSGHEGGANEWGREVAALLGAQLVLTTANPYLKPVYTVGMGCERGCPQQALGELLEHCLQQSGLDIDCIHSINSIDIKADEIGLQALAETLHKPFQTWSASQLGEVEPLLSTRSDYVYDTVGVYGVAESAALYAARALTGTTPELVLPKHKNARATCALARGFPPSVENESR